MMGFVVGRGWCVSCYCVRFGELVCVWLYVGVMCCVGMF